MPHPLCTPRPSPKSLPPSFEHAQGTPSPCSAAVHPSVSCACLQIPPPPVFVAVSIAPLARRARVRGAVDACMPLVSYLTHTHTHTHLIRSSMPLGILLEPQPNVAEFMLSDEGFREHGREHLLYSLCGRRRCHAVPARTWIADLGAWRPAAAGLILALQAAVRAWTD